MRSKAYSQNNPLRHLVFHTAKRYFWLPIAVFGISLIAFAGSEILSSGTRLGYIQRLSNINYYFKNEHLWRYFPFLLLLISVFCGKTMFSFLFSKKESAMYLLTGVSRRALFCVRYTFGLVSALVPSLISFFVLLLMGYSNVGQPLSFSKNTWLMLASLALLILCFYTVSVVASVVCGRKLEFFAVCLVFFFGPLGVLLFGAAVLSRFLHGFEYSIVSDKMHSAGILDVLNDYSALCPVIGYANAFSEYASSGFSNSELPLLDQSYLISGLAWMAAVSLVLVAAAGFLFKNRKAEFCGKSNKFPAVTAFCGCVIALGITAVILSWTAKLFVLYAVVSVTLIFLLVYFIFDGSIRRMAKGLKTALPLVATVLIFVFFVKADLFGYSSRVPDVDEILSVTVQYKGDYRGSGSMSQSMAHGFYSTHVDEEHWPALTSREDIQNAIDIHKLIIEDGSLIKDDGYRSNYGDTAVNVYYTLTYKLCDGSELSRSYPVMKLSTLYATLSVDRTEAFSQMRYDRMKNLFYHHHYEDEEKRKEFVSIFDFYCTDNMGAEKMFLILTDEEKAQLTLAIAADKKNATTEMRYHPQEECLGILWPVENRNNSFGTDENIFNITNNRIYIYSTDTNTLSWLETKGLRDVFESKYTVTSVTVYTADHYKNAYWKNRAIDRYFESIQLDQAFLNGAYSSQETVTDPARIDEILQKARSSYFTDTGNRYALITLKKENGIEMTVTKFLAD